MKGFATPTIFLVLLLVFAGCREEISSEPDVEETPLISDSNLIWVSAVMDHAGATSNSALGLTANTIDSAQLVVDGCLSGFHYDGSLQGIKLFRGDSNCLAYLSRFRLNGIDFFAPANPVAGAGSTQIYFNGGHTISVLVSTITQLSSPIVSNDQINFRVGYMTKGLSSVFTLTTVALTADAQIVVEGPSSTINFTLTRDQALEPLTVGVDFTGDALNRLKGAAIPVQVDFNIGQKVKVLSWTVPSNDLGEDDQTLDVELSPGSYLTALNSHAEVEIQDDAPRLTLGTQYQSNQAIDLNLAVSAEANTLIWETLSGPQALTFSQSLGKTFVSATIEGVYDFKLTATGVNGKIASASSRVTFDLNPPVIDPLQLADFLADGWLSIEDSQRHLPLIEAVVASDRSPMTLGYTLIQSQVDCDKKLLFGSVIPSADDPSLVANLSYKLCVRALDSFGWASFASSAPFSYQTFVPTAVLSNLPAANSALVNVSINVGGVGVVAYRYALIPGTDSCTPSANYGDESTASQISLNMTGRDSQSVKICVVAKSQSGNWQAFADATNYKWYVDLFAPAPVTQLNLIALSERVRINYDVATAEVLKYLIVRSEDPQADFSPVDGQTYNVGTQKGGMVVIYSGLKSEIFDSRIGSTNPAYYAIYVFDDTLNYSSPVSGSVSSPGPVPFNVAQGFDRSLRGGVKKQRLGNSGGFYAFGDFLQYGNNPAVTGIARFDSTGKLDPNFVTGIINGSVYAITEDSSGRIYIGGTFTKVGAVSTLRVARLLSNGSLDTSFISTAGPNSTVYALELDEQVAGQERLYMAGAFTAYGTRTVGRFAAVNLAGTLDANYATAIGSGFNNTIYTMRSVPNALTLLVGGSFTSFNAKTGNGFNRLSRITRASHNSPGTQDTSFAIAAGPNSNVYTLEFDASGNSYVGGAFTTVNGSSSYKYLMRLSPLGAVDTTYAVTKKFNGAVWALALDSSANALYAAGDFTLYGTAASNRLAKLALDASGTLDNNLATGIGSGFNAVVYGIALLPSGLVVGGSFNSFAGQNLAFMVRLSLSNYQAQSPLAAGSMFNAQTNFAAFGKNENEIYIGGTFTQYRGKLVNRLVRVDGSGVMDNAYAPVLNGNVNTMLYSASDSSLVIAGTFSTVGAATQKRITRLLSNGTVDPAFVGGVKAFDSDVYALAQGLNGKIWAGGKFTTYNSLPQNKLARLLPSGNPDTTFTLAGTGIVPTTATVNAIVATADGGAFIAGTFTSYNGVSANRIVKLAADGNIDSSFVVGTGFNNTVRHMIIVDNLLYVAGDFTTYQGVTQNRLARIKMDGKLDTTFALGAGFNNPVYYIGFDANSRLLYLTGSFTTVQGVSSSRIAALRLTGVRDTALVAPLGFNNTGLSVLSGKNGILVTGAFNNFESKLNDFVSRISYYGSQN